jgi:5-methylcytosine-specific restriction endonuclease McrA
VAEWVHVANDPEHVAREKCKAKQLRKTQWWRRQIARGTCYYCGNTFPPEELTMDHVVPISRGGRSVKGNVVPCCKECNNKKKYYTPADLILGKLNQDEGDKT